MKRQSGDGSSSLNPGKVTGEIPDLVESQETVGSKHSHGFCHTIFLILLYVFPKHLSLPKIFNCLLAIFCLS